MPEVVVVGAGISGLCAAYRLRQAGVEAVVLEQQARPGGRIHSVQVNDAVMEAGATFYTSAYQLLPALAAELGLTPRTVSSASAVVHRQRLYPLRSNRPLTAVRSGLLSWRDGFGMLPGLSRFAASCRGRGTVDSLDWLALDSLPAREWAEPLGLPTLLERAWRPAYHGFYVGDTEQTSAAGVAAMAAHGLRQRTLTLPGGLARLPWALAGRLQVRTQVQVHAVEAAEREVLLRTSAGELRASRVVVTVPGPALTGLWALDPLEAAVAATPYTRGLLVGLGVRRRLRDDELGGAYGVLLAPGSGPLAAVCVASRAGHASGAGDLVTCLLTDQQAHLRAEQNDAEILDAAREALLAWEPRLGPELLTDPERNRVARIEHAMPASPPGRLAAIAAYRRSAPGRRVLIAGDVIAWPWSDSAAGAGAWAAQVVGPQSSR